MYSINELIPNLTLVKATISSADMQIVELAYDTRKIHNGVDSLFFALKNQRDGHDFIYEAYRKGVRNFVVSDINFNTSNFLNCNFIWVKDTLKALQEIAIFHRNRFSFPIIGITGSNGKTIVKEWLFELLSHDFNCYQSPKSYNSQLGVALSLWKLNQSNNLAIIEAGISREGEMESLGKMIQPNIGVFTTLGTAHKEGFESRENKGLEKWKLFQSAKVIICSRTLSDSLNKNEDRILTWGNSPKNYIHVKSIRKEEDQSIIEIEANNFSHFITSSFIDQASIENMLTCITVMTYLGYSMEVIKQRVSKLKPLEMRLMLKKGKNNSSIIDDSYSNDLASLQIALDFLYQQNQYKSKKLIISDFEGEKWSDKFENKLLNLIGNNRLDELFLIGSRYLKIKDKLQNARFFKSTEELYSMLSTIEFENSTVLIKGARKFELEKITAALVAQSHETVLEINLKAIEHNIQQFKTKIDPSVKLMVMVKAFSYGAGSFEVANVLQFNQVDYLTVAFVDEGVALRRAGITLPIMVLSPHESSFEDLVFHKLEPEIYSMRILDSFSNFLRIKRIEKYPVHIKLDTGMHRLGFMPEEIEPLTHRLTSESQLTIVSIFSHLVGAGNPDLESFTQQQINLFIEQSERIEREIGYKVLKHICNSSGILKNPEAHLDMVRLGVGLYGINITNQALELEQVNLLKTTISQIKNLTRHETVGYDRKGVLHRDSVIATVKIGYADGYNRLLGNGVGKMMINGQLVPTVGNVCMDMCMLDITDIKAKEGDEVIVYPELMETAKALHTIPYELLTNISSRVKRVYYYE